MPIRGRVGRRANTGRHCQNWKDDQQTVIKLLNAIPADKGGAEGSLKGDVVAGIAGDGLYQAILTFQKKHFPARQTGFIEPAGDMLGWMEMQAAPKPAPPPPAPKKPNQWSELKTGPVKRAVTAGLDDDMKLSHADVVNIIRSTLSDGVITSDEMDDLATVSAKARSISSRTRRMLDMLVVKIKKSASGNGPYELPLEKHRIAAQLACDFLERPGVTQFPYLDRMDVGTGLLMRIANPGLMNQDKAGLCGPASVLFNLAYDDPVGYARFAIDLFEKGKASFYRLNITPGGDLRSYTPPETMDQVDWMTMASLRDDENWFFDYQSVSDSGGSSITEMMRWFQRAGYRDVRDETTMVLSAGVAEIDSANELFAKGYRIVLRINANMLYEAKQSNEGKHNHFVVQRSPIDRTGGKIRLKVFTWGKGNYDVPNGKTDLSVDDFLGNFYGYIAARPY